MDLYVTLATLGGEKWWVDVLGHYSNNEWRRPRYSAHTVLDCAFSLACACVCLSVCECVKSAVILRCCNV
eukprot:scaffold65067_cov67-Phaeocystis_antarctica.AAC.5